MWGMEHRGGQRLHGVKLLFLMRIFLLTVPEELLQIKRGGVVTETVQRQHLLLRQHVRFPRTSQRDLSTDFSPPALRYGFGYLFRGDISKNIRGLRRTFLTEPLGLLVDLAYRYLIP